MAEIKLAKPADAIDEAGDALEDGPDADGDTMAALATAGAAAETPSANDTGALLDMFSEVSIETVDRTVLTNLAGEVDMVDLIAELNVVAAAMGIVRAQHEAAATVTYEEEKS